MIPVGRLAPFDQWDNNILDQLFDNQLYPTGLDFKRYDGYPHTDGCILIIPGRYWHQQTDQINEAVQPYRWLLGIRTGDEEDQFDINAIEHPNIKWWVQTPHTHTDYMDARLFGVGYPPHFNQLDNGTIPQPTTNVFISAQNTHQRRKECFDTLLDTELSDTLIMATNHFTDGLPPHTYATAMCTTKVAPCPAGPASPDTFRLYEALQAHTVPIADDITPAYDSAGYWHKVHPDAPFQILTSYEHLTPYIKASLQDWPANANRITAWWIAYKRRMARWLHEDLEALGAL